MFNMWPFLVLNALNGVKSNAAQGLKITLRIVKITHLKKINRLAFDLKSLNDDNKDCL